VGPTMKVLTLGLASVLVLAPAPTVPVAGAQRSAHESAFSGQPVPKVSHQSPTAVTCESDHADSTGYYPRNWSLRMADPKANAEVLLKSAFERQRQTTRWAITLGGEEASVVSGQEASAEVYRVVRRDTRGVILVSVRHGAFGGTVQVLTIDPLNGSFVSSDTSVGPLFNRATVWVGRCY